MADFWWDCNWQHRTELSIVASANQENYSLPIELSSTDFDPDYIFTSDGADLRVLDANQQRQLDFFVEQWDPVSRSAVVNIQMPRLRRRAETVYLYYGNSSDVPISSEAEATFSRSGWRFHTRKSDANPSSEQQARADFDNAADGNSGYGCAILPTLSGQSNTVTFGSVNTDIGIYGETYFYVDTPGQWSFRFATDFGHGGGFYIDGVAVEEHWDQDIWWRFDWEHSDVMHGSLNLTRGYHHLEVLGFEGCCSGPLDLQFRKPGSSQWQNMAENNIRLLTRSCPAGRFKYETKQITAPTLFGGSVFVDNGLGGTAHDGVVGSNETGIDNVRVVAKVSGSGSNLRTTTDTNGEWSSCDIGLSAGKKLQVRIARPSGYIAVSESMIGVNTNPRLNGHISFPIDPATNYTEINFGYVERPTFVSDHETTLGADRTVTLPHVYTATTDATVYFALSELENDSEGGYSYQTYLDADCDSVVDQVSAPLPESVSVQAGDKVCVLIKVSAEQGADEDAELELRIETRTDFTGSDIVINLSNTDEIEAEVVRKLTLEKQVCNASRDSCDLISGAGFRADNVGAPTEELIYRIRFVARSNNLNNVRVHDVVPDFTELKPSSITVAAQPTGVDCQVVEPLDQSISGYTGAIEWHCLGEVDRNRSGIVGFSVLID